MRAIIVDHESSARFEVARLCEQAGIEVVAHADSGINGIAAIRMHAPDLVLLEADLKDMSGFEVLRASEVWGPDPMVIMVTAQPQHALRAFEYRAIDFLTKPIEPRRFISAISRARHWLGREQEKGDADDNGSSLSGCLSGPDTYLIAEKARRLHFLEATTIDYIQSDRNYLAIHVGDECYLSRNTLKHVTALLTRHGFIRIDRSLLINLRKVAFVDRFRHGRGVAFVMHNGEQLACGKTYRREILRELRRGHLMIPARRSA